MPRALDPKQLTPDYDPTRSGTEFHFGNLLKDMAELWPLILEQVAGNLLGPLLEAFADLTGIDLSPISSLLEDLDFSSPEAFLLSIFNLIMALPGVLIELAAGLIGGGTGGTNLLSGLFSLIPLGSIFNTNTNFLADPLFMLTNWITDALDWAMGTISSVTGGGSVTTIADGFLHALPSINMLNVAPGQQFDMSLDTMWTDLVTTVVGPIQLVVKQFFNGVPVEAIPTSPGTTFPIRFPVSHSNGEAEAFASTVGGLTHPIRFPVSFGRSVPSHFTPDAAVVLDTTGADGDSDWTTLSGSYTVPSGVNGIQMMMQVVGGATAGTVWFSNGSITQPVSSNIAPQHWVTGLPDSLADLLGFAQDIIDNLLGAVLGVIPDGGLLEDLFGEFTSWFDGTVDTAVGLDTLGGGVQDMLDNIVQSAGNVFGAGFSIPNLFDSIMGHTTQIADLNAGLAALKADQQAQIVSGKSFTVNFADHPDAAAPPSIFTKVADMGTGSIVTSGDVLVWSGGSVVGREWYRYNLEELLTDFFEVSLIMPQQSQRDWLFGGTGNAFHYLLGRSNLAGTTLCFCRWTVEDVRIGCIVAGSTTMTSPTWFHNGTNTSAVPVSAPAGSYVTFRGGTLGGGRVFQFLVNNTVRATFQDMSAVSTMGIANRWVGVGLESDNTYEPGNISQWTANDNVQPPIVGSGARMYRSSTAAVALSTAAGDTILNTVCDTLEYVTPDITANVSQSSYKVSRDGFYKLEFRAQSQGTAFGTNSGLGSIAALVVVNGGIYKRCQPISASVAGAIIGSAVGDDAIYASTSVYLHANDTVQMGAHNSTTMGTLFGAHGLVGEGSGASTYFEICLENWNTL